MCHIKTKSRICDSSDLSGLITGIILRQSCPFRKEHIFSLVKENSKGARYFVNDMTLKSIIESRLDLYERNDDLQLRRGVYYPRALEKYL